MLIWSFKLIGVETAPDLELEGAAVDLLTFDLNKISRVNMSTSNCSSDIETKKI